MWGLGSVSVQLFDLYRLVDFQLSGIGSRLFRVSDCQFLMVLPLPLLLTAPCRG